MRWAAWIRQGLALFCLALMPAVLQAVYLRDRISWTRPAANEMKVAQAVRLGEAVMWVDARPEEEFAADHIPGATLLNAENWDSLLPVALNAWMPGKVVVVYCSKKNCGASGEIARRLREEANLQNVFVLEGGWEAWQGRGSE